MPSLVGVALAVRGSRSRLVGSVATLLVALVATAAATLGPLYAATGEDSLVRQRLAQVPAAQSGLVVSANLFDQSASVDRVVDRLALAAADSRYDGYWGAPSLAVQSSGRTVVIGGSRSARATVSWRRGMCVSVAVVRGRCPGDAPAGGVAEAMISTRTAAEYRVGPGARLSIDLGAGRAGANDPVVVGVYDAKTVRGPGWSGDSSAQAGSAGDSTQQLDEVLVDRATMVAAQAGTTASAFRPLRVGEVHARDTAALARLAAPTALDVQVSAQSAVGGVVAELDGERQLVRAATTAVTVQVGVLALFVLYLVVAATAEERGPEVALAKLRGMRTGQTAAFALAEPVGLLAVAVPLGALVALLADVALARGLSPGSEVRFGATAAAAAGAALLGGVAAAALAGRRLLATPVLGQLRRTGGRNAALARSVALDTAAVVAAAAGVYELLTRSADLLGLVTPGLLALAVALLVVRLVPPAARVAVRRTRRGPRLPAFLAARNIARRPAGSRLVVLLAVAVALAVFGVNGDAVARTVRLDSARASVGAPQVVHVTSDSPGRLLAAVRAADPTGRRAMAVEQAAGGAAPTMLAVDVTRLAAVTSWDPAWGGTSFGALERGLRPDTGPAVTVQRSLTARWTNAATGRAGNLQAGVQLITADGDQVTVGAGRLAPRSHGHLRMDLPACRSAPCQLIGWTFTRAISAGPTGQPEAATADPFSQAPATSEGTFGAVTVTDITDARGPVTAPAVQDSRWRYALAAADVLNSARPADVGVSDAGGGGFTVALDPGSVASFAVAPAVVPPTVPALLGRDAAVSPFDGSTGTGVVQDLADQAVIVSPVPGRGTLPRVGTAADLVDLQTLTVNHPQALLVTDDQVWFADSADSAAILSRLADAGIRPVDADPLRPVTVETVDHQVAVLATGGAAVSLRVYVAAAVAAILLALGAALTAGLVAAPRRSYEVAAVLVLGGRRRSLVRAGVAEQLAYVGLGTVVGFVTGVVATRLVLPVLGSVTAGAPAPPELVRWPVVIAVAVAVLVLAFPVTALVSRRAVGLGRLDRLREVQA